MNAIKAAACVTLAILLAVSASAVLSTDSDAATSDSWDGSVDTNWYDTEKKEFTLRTAEELAGLAELVNKGNTFKGMTIVLSSDIDLSGHAWTPIGFNGKVNLNDSNELKNDLTDVKMFEGTFNGDGNTISNLTSAGYSVGVDDERLSYEDTYTYGLFGFINDATISDIKFEKLNIDLGSTGSPSCDSAGALAGYGLGTTTIERIIVSDGTVTSANAAGGVIGCFYGDNLTVSNCECDVAVKSTDSTGGKAGGIAGNIAYVSNAEFTDCKSTGSMSGAYAGGIIALANSNTPECTQKFSKCSVSDSQISASLMAGGIAARGAIGVQFASCSVAGSAISAGVETDTYASSAGGIMGAQGGATNTVSVTSCSVTDCTIKAENNAGGMIGSTLGPEVTVSRGSVSGTTTISATYTSGTDDMTNAGGVVGIISTSSGVEQTILIDGVEFRGNVSLEASNEDYVINQSLVCKVMEGAAVAHLSGQGTFDIRNMSDFGGYELIAQSSFYNVGHTEDDKFIFDKFSTITFSACETENIMEWSIQGSNPKVFVEDGSDLAGFRINTQTILLGMSGDSTIHQLIAGADEDTAKLIEDKVYVGDKKDKNTWVTGGFVILSGQTVTVDSVQIMDKHNQYYKDGQLVREYYGVLTGDDTTSCLKITGTGGSLQTGTYLWDGSDGWVLAAATVTDSEGNSASYATIAEAMGAAEDGDTVTILIGGSITSTISIEKDITLDLNDCTITNGVTDDSMILIKTGASVTIIASGANAKIIVTSTETTIVAENGSTLVIKSGTFYKDAVEGTILEAKGNLTVDGGQFDFYSSVDDNRGYAIRVTYGAEAVINNVTINSEKAGILVRGYDGDVTPTVLTVENATINSSYYAFAVFGHGYEDDGDNDNVVLTVKNATVTMPTDSSNPESAAFGTNADGGTNAGHRINIEGGTYISNTGCYFPSYGEYNISGGTFNSSMYGIRICAGELSISGSASINVDAEGTATSLVPDDGKTDRPTGTMGPLTIGKQTSTGYPGGIVVKIEAGTLTNNTDGGNAITVYDDNLASETYKGQTISVNVSGGTVTGDVEYVHTDDTGSDANDVSYEMTGGTVDGDIVADKSQYSDNITIESGKITGAFDEEFLGDGMIVDDSGEVVPDPDVVFEITSENFFNLAKKDSDGTLVFELDRNYHIKDNNGRLAFDKMTDQSYTGIVINGNGHTLYGALSFDATYNDGDTQSYSVTINDLNLDGSKASDNNWNYGISVQNQSPAETDHSPRPIDFTMIGGSVSNYGSKGIYITTATSVTIDGVDVVNCAYDPHFNDEANDVFYYYTRGDYAIDIDITGVTCTAIDITDVTFSGETGAVASLKIAQRGGAGDDPETWGEATIGTVTLSGLDFTDSNAPTDIILGSEPYTSSDDTAEDETRDYNSAFDVNLTAQGETSLSVWGADRQPSNGNNLRLDLTNGSVVSTTGQKNDENGSIGIELVSGSARVSGQLLPSMYLTADEDSVTFGDFEDISGGNLELIAPEPDPPFNPGWADDDDDVVIPPTIVVDDSSSSDDDEAVKIAACAAAAVAAAIIALFLIATYRKN